MDKNNKIECVEKFLNFLRNQREKPKECKNNQIIENLTNKIIKDLEKLLELEKGNISE